jgi:hypothetical protein
VRVKLLIKEQKLRFTSDFGRIFTLKIPLDLQQEEYYFGVYLHEQGDSV